MHILVVPLPIQGHMNPMLDLSKLLVTSLGCNISFVTARSALELAAARGVKASTSGINFVPLEDQDGAKYSLPDSIRFMASKGPEIQQLCLASELGPVSLNLLDFLLLQPLKQHVSGPVVAFWSSSAAMMHLSMNIRKLLEASQVKGVADDDDDGEITVNIPGTPSKLRARDLPRDPIDPTYKSMLELRQPLLEVSRVLINTFQALEHSSLSALQLEGFKVVPVGPLCGGPEPKLGNSEPTLEWLRKQTPGSVIFISFGTMIEASGEHIREIAAALEEMGRPFLWSLNNLDPSCGQFVEGFKLKTGDRGMVTMVSCCPQQQVLRSPSIGVFLTHCGWNSTIESVACGVPMVGWPQMGDQPVNCKYMAEEWKLGCRLEEATRAGIKKAVDLVMGSSEMHTRAEQMRYEAAQARLNSKFDLIG